MRLKPKSVAPLDAMRSLWVTSSIWRAERVSAPSLVVAVLTTVLVVRVIDVAHSLRQEHSTQVASISAPPLAVMPTRQQPASGDALNHVLAAHLFGQDLTASGADTGPAPARWVLSGVIAGDSPESGYAILGESAESTHLRAVGEQLGGGYRLVAVLSDRVTVVGRDQRFTLTLPHARSSAGGLVARAAGVGGSDAGGASSTKYPNGLWAPPKGMIGAQSPAQIALRPQPSHDESGAFDGMRVTGQDARLSEIGLQHSDVITAVNGQAISSPAAMQRALLQLSAGAPMTVTVSRGGTKFDVPVTISQGGS